MKSDEFVEIAKIGKVVGLNGFFKFHNLSDFYEQFKKNATFTTDKNETLTIQEFNKEKSIIKFFGIDDRDSAQKYVNTILKTTISQTRKNIKLKKDEFFWFDIVGCEIAEEGKILGVVKEIERIGVQDYLFVKSDDSFDRKKFEETFLFPYIDRYIKEVDLEHKKIFTKDVRYFLEK